MKCLNKVCWYRIGLILLGMLSVFSLRAQQFNFQNRVEDFPTECYCVLQDSKGLIWVSSERGLYCYDGNRVKRFDLHNGFHDPNIFQLTEDKQGRILFADWTSEIGCIQNDSIVFPALNKKLKQFLRYGSREIFNVYSDSNGILWITTYGGIYKTLKPWDYSDIEKINEPYADSCRSGIKVFDRKKALCALFNGGITLMKDSSRYRLFVDFYGKNYIISYCLPSRISDPTQHATIELNDGNILWALYNKVYTFRPDGHYTTKTFDFAISYLKLAKDGGVWVGSQYKGLYYYNNTSFSGTPIHSLPDCSVTGITEDNENGIWVTTLEKGVFYARNKKIIDYSNVKGCDGKIAGIGIFRDKVLLNNSSSYISVIRDTSEIRRVDIPAYLATISVEDFQLKGKDIYLASLPTAAKVDTTFSKWAELSSHPSNEGVRHLNDLALSAAGNIIGIYHNAFDTIYNDTFAYTGTLPARGRCLCVLHSGEILIGTSNGIYKFQSGKFIPLGINGSVVAIKESAQGNVWAVYNDGVYVIKDDKVVNDIKGSKGFLSNSIPTCMDIDDEGNVWVGSDMGLSKISAKDNYSVESFDTKNGLISNEIMTLAVKHNCLWIGTDIGLCLMDIAHEPINNVPPPVYIGSVRVNDSLMRKKTDFLHYQNNFLFHVVGITFKDAKQRFECRLIGSDTTWRFYNFPDIPFSNLSPGDYRLEVKAINADGTASIQPALFSFTIEKPFWKLWWFIALELLALGGIIIAFIQYRLKIIRARESEKTRINKVLAEYQMTALRAQMNPHFIFNAINSIQEYVLENNPQMAYDYLTKFAQLIRMVLNNAKEKYITLEKELETLNIYVELEQLRFGNRFDFILDLDENTDSYGIHLPAMIIQPYVENAIWHGLMPLGDARKGRLLVKIVQQENEFVIMVEDNGVGRERAAQVKKMKQHKSVGMELNRQRLEMLSNLPEYNSSSIAITDLYEQDGKPKGTRVEIKIIYKPEQI